MVSRHIGEKRNSLQFRVRWQDVVKKSGDAATNDVCSIRQVSESQYRVETFDHAGSNSLAANTAEGVDLLLEEYYVKDEGWKRA